mgnify:CR=1 FL=1|tara:strand:- start:60 stop:455 length:396 start_codon:yes stop_codon:yes gene_type:complete
MTVKLVLLKSGEDIVADVSEMVVGDENDKDNPPRVIGYYLNRPCVIRMQDARNLPELTNGNEQKQGYSVSLFPWMPLSKEDKIPIPADWMITMVEPVTKLAQMYDEDIVKHGKDNQSDSTDDDSTDSDQSD